MTDSDDRRTPPASTHRQICTYPPRAKGSLNRRFKRFSLVAFFLQKKKATRAGARNSPSPARHFLIRCRSPDCACTAFRCRCLLLRQKLFVLPCRRLRNNYILCPTGTPTFAAARRQRRDLIIANASSAPDPTLAQRQRQRRKRYKRSLNRQCYPLHFMRECIPPNLHDPQRAKGSLDRRSKRLSFPHFFLRRKKCGRRRPPPRQGKTDSPPGRRNPPRAKGP